MKPAQVDDAWRRLRSARRALVGIEFAWDGVPKLTKNSLKLRNPFTIICGENGVGKSTLLHTLLHALVAPDRRGDSAVFVRGEEGSIQYVRVELGDGKWGGARTLFSLDSVREHFDSLENGLRVALFDPAMHVPIILNAIHGDANFSEVLDPIGVKVYSETQVQDLSYIVGRDYQSVSAYEIEGYAGLGVFPYFKARVADIEYGSEEMGFGELSLLLGYWLLSGMPEGSIILLEEPETFVSPRSQTRFMNVAARIAQLAGHMIVATTHSPSVVSRFREEEITLVSRSGRAVTLMTPTTNSVLERRLELVNPARRLWFVEDRMAARQLSFFLSKADLSSMSDVIVVGNNDAVLKAAAYTAFGESRIVVNGILDGNEREAERDLPPNITFLPGTRSSEETLRHYLTTSDIVTPAGSLGVSEQRLELAIAASGGEEAHEWANSMRKDLEISLDQFVVGVLGAWAASNEVEIADFLASLRTMAKLGL